MSPQSFDGNAVMLVSESLHLPIREFIQTRGKQLRGSLVALSYTIVGGRGELPSEIAQAIEWLHAGSLVVDDVQDGSLLRRGRPTLHRQLGVPLAINAGNYMYFRALEFITAADLPSELRQQLTAEMVRIARLCHEGQAIDLAARVDRLPVEAWLNVVEEIAVRKTGALVELALRMGAISAGASRPLCELLGRAGSHVGIALQMRNDLDELAEACHPLKASGEVLLRLDDLRNRRATWGWGWLTKISDRARCEELAIILKRGCEQRDERLLFKLAAELHRCVKTIGENEIARQMETAMRLLGEYILDPEALALFRDCLSPIEQGRRDAAPHDSDPEHESASLPTPTEVPS